MSRLSPHITEIGSIPCVPMLVMQAKLTPTSEKTFWMILAQCSFHASGSGKLCGFRSQKKGSVPSLKQPFEPLRQAPRRQFLVKQRADPRFSVKRSAQSSDPRLQRPQHPSGFGEPPPPFTSLSPFRPVHLLHHLGSAMSTCDGSLRVGGRASVDGLLEVVRGSSCLSAMHFVRRWIGME